jgi:multisubunit Na+/H+ antiporter MnhG subunit
MRLHTWKVLLSLTLGAITSIIGVSVWALETNNYDLTRLGLLILFAICVVGSGWIIMTLAAVFKTIEHTLLSVDEIKAGLLEAQVLLREYEEASCTCIEDLLDEHDKLEEFLSNDKR